MSDDTLVLRKYMKNVGRAYRKQAVTFIRFCRGLNAEIHSGGNANDRALRDALLLVDQALDAVVKAGTGTSAEADSALASAQEALEKFGHVLGLKDKAEEFGKELNGARDKDKKTTTAIAKIKESIGVTPGSGLKRGKVMKLDFVLRNESLLPSSKDLIVHQEFEAPVQADAILWSFSRFRDHRRVTLKQNPHFYTELPKDAAGYKPEFEKRCVTDFSNSLHGNDTVYVLVDKPCRLYLEATKPHRAFGNLWKPYDAVILKDSEGTLQGEAVVRKHVTVGVTTWHRHTIGHTSCQTRSSTGPLDQGCYPGGDFTAPPKSWHDLLMKAFACRCVDFLIRAEGSISKESDGWMPIREQRKPPTPRQPNPRPTQPKAHGRVSSSSNQSSSTLSLDTTSIFDATGSTSSFATTISPSESSPPSVRSLGSISDRDHRLSPVDSSTRSPIEKKALHSAPPTASLRSPTRSYPQTSTHNKNLGPLPPGPPGPNRALPTMLSSESSRPPRSRREAEQPKESLKPPKQA